MDADGDIHLVNGAGWEWSCRFCNTFGHVISNDLNYVKKFKKEHTKKHKEWFELP